MTAILRLQLDDKDPVRVNSAINQLAEYYDINQRTRLTTNTTFYVSTSGSDSNSGSQASPFLTIQHAYDVIVKTLDFSGQTVTVSVADGTYTNGLNITGPWTGGGALIFQGNMGSPANCIVNPAGNAFAINTSLPGTLTLTGFKIGGTGTDYAILHNGIGLVNYAHLDFAACNSIHVSVVKSGASVTSTTNYTISGGALEHWQGLLGGSIVTQTQTIALVGTPNFSIAFAVADVLGILYLHGLTFSGSATGQRYQSNNNSVIHTGGGGATYLPGNVAGTPTPGVIGPSGGIYV